MAGRTSLYLPFILAAAVILCYAAVSLPSTFNPIRIASSSDGLNHLQSSPQQNPRRTTTIEAIYQFGDSMSDTGNFIREHPTSNFANSPYGLTFFHKPTGRCSDGLLIIDYFSRFFKLPFLDPYHNREGNFTHGVNFAVAAATAMNCSTLAMKDIKNCPTNSSLLVQLDWFKSHLHSICSTASECKEKLATALIMMGEIGGNDYNWAFFQGNPIEDIYKMVPEVVQVIKETIKEVINLGAIRIVVPGNFPIGCMTCYLDMFKTNDASKYDELQCLKHLNAFAVFHNNQIQQAIGEIQEDYPYVTIVYADYYTALREILRNATSLGFDKDVMQIACCDHCGSKRGPICEHPYKH
ncbi:hypothetical protein SOVF_154570, partial [Spinacia oleracea]